MKLKLSVTRTLQLFKLWCAPTLMRHNNCRTSGKLAHWGFIHRQSASSHMSNKMENKKSCWSRLQNMSKTYFKCVNTYNTFKSLPKFKISIKTSIILKIIGYIKLRQNILCCRNWIIGGISVWRIKITDFFNLNSLYVLKYSFFRLMCFLHFNWYDTVSHAHYVY